MIEPFRWPITDFGVIIIKYIIVPMVKGSVERLKFRYLAFINKILKIFNKSCGIFFGIDNETQICNSWR
jgi:hypothetical protein